MNEKKRSRKMLTAKEFMKREIRVTKAGFLYVDGKKASEKRITPLYVGADVLTSEEQKITRKWAFAHYEMVNN
jgi:hypothetical protein